MTSGSADGSELPPPLVSSAWRLIRLGREPVSLARPITLAFAGAGRVGGSAGCNRYGGSVELDGATIAFAELVSTRMACPPPVMAVESAFLAALAAARTWRFDEAAGELVIGGSDELAFELDAIVSEPGPP